MSKEKQVRRSKGGQKQEVSKELGMSFPTRIGRHRRNRTGAAPTPKSPSRRRRKASEDKQMSKDNFEGVVRSTLGKAEQVVGEVSQDQSTVSQGRYDEAAGKVPSAIGNAKDAISSSAYAVSALDFSSLQEEIAKLTQMVSDLVQKQASSARTQIMDAVGSAADNISQSTSVAQDKLQSLEAEVGSSVQKNPWSAVLVAALVGLFVGRLT